MTVLAPTGILTAADCMAQWTAKLRDAASRHPAVSFDGKAALAAYLMATLRDQAERVFINIDGTPVEDRDLAAAEKLIDDAMRTVVVTWGDAIDRMGAGREAWAHAALKDGAEAYAGRLDELAPGLHRGGRA